jgi:hypothetical protein
MLSNKVLMVPPAFSKKAALSGLMVAWLSAFPVHWSTNRNAL